MAEEAGSRIGPGTKIRGVVECKGPLVVAGDIDGTFRGKELLIKSGGRVAGEVTGEHIDCAGRIEGNIHTRTLVLRDSGSHVGTVETEELQVERGAVLDCALQSGGRYSAQPATGVSSRAPLSRPQSSVLVNAFTESGHPCCMDVPWSERALLLTNVIELLAKNKPLIKITGESGSGKSVFIDKLLANTLVSYEFYQVGGAEASVLDLLGQIALKIGLPSIDGLTQPELLTAIREMLTDKETAGRKVVLLVDDAHLLYPATAEGIIRLLTSVHDDGEDLLQMILLGTAEMEEILVTTIQEYFEDETNCQLELAPLTIKDTAEYIRLGIQRQVPVGDSHQTMLLIPYETIKEVHSRSEGNIGAINRLLTEAIARADRAGSPLVSPHFV